MSSKNNKFNYPNFEPKQGHLTQFFQQQFIKHQISIGKLSQNAMENDEITSLVASNNPKDPLYFWQLYSITGEELIHILIEDFYTNIFKDTNNKWFSEEFIELGPIKYHVNGQKKFWLDLMGGGYHYTGGYKKLYMKHKMTEIIMTRKGAIKWMEHMNKTLKTLKNHFQFDSRIYPTIIVFLKFLMEKYAQEFNFKIHGVFESKL